MSLRIVRNDLSKVHADVIVMSANPEPVCGGSSDLSVYNAAGYEDMLAARKKLGSLAVGEVGVTPAFALNSKYVFHTVGPVWNGGNSGEFLALCACYRESLKKALELGCESIAFPLISSGVYQFPKDKALSFAIETIKDFLRVNELDVILVVYDHHSFEISLDLFNDVQSFIDENYVVEKRIATRAYACKWNREPEIDFERHLDEECFAEKRSYESVCEVACSESLDEILDDVAETFQQKLFNLIREKNRDDVDVYKKANLDRKHFSKIRSDIHYSPKKKTALALAIALQLNLDETNDLLSRAGLALSPSDRGDLIVTYFITHSKYDIWEINTVLFKYGQTGLGA